MEGLKPGEWIVRRGADALEEGTPLDVSKEMESKLLEGIKKVPSLGETPKK
jgi:hypothetical protein